MKKNRCHQNVYELFDDACAQLIHKQHVTFKTFYKHFLEMKERANHDYGTPFISLEFTISPSSSGEFHEGFLVTVMNPIANIYRTKEHIDLYCIDKKKNKWRVGWIDVAKGYVQR